MLLFQFLCIIVNYYHDYRKIHLCLFFLQAMKVACKKFQGEHDFTNFCKMDAANVHNYMRTISNFDILPCNEE